ncbi:proteasomal ATPase-associated factor 1-like [Aricia agestis]|uniref:proteasomal ATPase-associated factor 1-like n=1 Tax=Aricia agestis TaxID=91739 RepID=UPI001C2059CC|nr:proteasomal ATPase-associated factor 1-like [Aricia agestis]
MSLSENNSLPAITIQYNWNEVLKHPNKKIWISTKYLNKPSFHDSITTTVNESDGKLKVNVSEELNFISISNLSIVLKDVKSGLKIAFVAPNKVHDIHAKAILSVSMTENALAVSSCEQDRLVIWDTRTNEEVLDLVGHGGPAYKCRFFPSGTVVISAGADGSCRIWCAETGINPVTLKGHTMSVADICMIGRGRNVITVSKDGTAKLWDVGQALCIADVIDGQGAINCCTITTTTEEVLVENPREFNTGNKLLVIGCENGCVVGAHVGKRQELFRRQLEAACNASIVMGDVIIVGCSDGKIVYLSPEDGSVVMEIHESMNPVLSMAVLSKDLYAVGRQDGNVVIISMQKAHSHVRVQLTGSDCDGIRDIAFNGKWVLTGSRDSYVRKYDFNQICVHFKR